MAKSKKTTGGDSPKKAPWIDADEAPPLAKAFFKRATLNKAGQPLRGRPKQGSTKQAVSLRLDPDVVRAFKAQGPGWQSAMNASLRRAAGLSTKPPARSPSRKAAK
ncbi:MAG: BrnA antitoxin family protein [Hyphomonadaceae bacterium]|nr:BrnA antitoxin family protein [Hyphomonadaceae bacterium]